jgi:hypothetical protein
MDIVAAISIPLIKRGPRVKARAAQAYHRLHDRTAGGMKIHATIPDRPHLPDDLRRTADARTLPLVHPQLFIAFT